MNMHHIPYQTTTELSFLSLLPSMSFLVTWGTSFAYVRQSENSGSFHITS